MATKDDEEERLRSVALQNAQSILLARRRAEEALRKQSDWLRVTLASIGDAVISTDAEGRVTFMNGVAEALTGWTQTDAIGRPLPEILHIVNEQTRQSVENPALRALREGIIVGLANHTLLIAQDGTERPIDDSAAPIRNEQGEVGGVVLVFRDITERKAIEADLERLLAQEHQARAAAEAAARAKDEFLSVVSHELRNPLNSILGYARLTRMNPHDAAQVARHCEIIERNAKMQQQLIEDLLDTARIASGKLKIEAAPTDLRLVLEDALAVVRPAAEAKQLDLVARLGDEPQPVIGDAARLQQVAWNLLQNAVKFTPNGGRVELCMERADQHVRLIVSDTGKGIEPEFLPAVFDRFSQNDMSRTRRHGGLGLGLALVKQLVELHGGTIEAASAGADRGATFTITLPLRAPQVAAPLPQVRALAEISHGPEAISLAGLPRLDEVRVLIVEDLEEARMLVADTLSEWGAVVTAAASGQEAEVLLDQATFDVLVCDIAMPDVDGYEVLRRIRARERQRGVPFAQYLPAIALTARARPEDRLQAFSAGFQMHVAKPVELAELVMVIASLIGNRQSGVAVDSTLPGQFQ